MENDCKYIPFFTYRIRNYGVLPKFVRTMELMTTFNCIKFYLHEVLSLSLSVTMTSNYGTMIKVWFKSCAKLDE